MSVAGLPKKEANVPREHDGLVLAARFNSEGNYYLSYCKDRTIRLWNPHRGIHIKTYKSRANYELESIVNVIYNIQKHVSILSADRINYEVETH